MNEKERDRQLGIKTIGIREWLTDSIHHNRYEATPYQALDELFQQYSFDKTDVVIDFGCGKGRLPFYIHHHFGNEVAGVEVSEALYADALQNLVHYSRKKTQSKNTIRFECLLAEKYIVQKKDTVFYFFNPFSSVIFMQVLHNIIASYEEHQRQIDIILFYPTEDYLYFLENATPFYLLQEIPLAQLHKKNANERFVIFRANGK